MKFMKISSLLTNDIKIYNLNSYSIPENAHPEFIPLKIIWCGWNIDQQLFLINYKH
jgi:hypothetical protein